MKTTMKKMAVIAGAAAALASGAAMAESTYGYDSAGTGTVSATAKLDITVTVPKLILLRVGTSDNTVDVATLTATLNTGIPGGIANPLTAGNSQASGWDGTAPVWSTASSSNVQAWAWTNSTGGGKVDAAVTTAFLGTSGLTAADITVASTAVLGGGLAHPGTDTGTNVTTSFARNTVVSSTWVFSIAPAALANVVGGSNTERMTYTATSL